MILPEGWKIYRFDQLAESINERVLPADADGLPYVGLEHLDSESLKIRRWGSPDEVEAQKLRFYTGDIIFGKRRYYQKKLAVADFDGICSAHAMVLRAKADIVLPEFLPFFMQSEMFFERAMSISVGSLSPTINWTALGRQEFPLPPLDEQHRIAEILWGVEESIGYFVECRHLASIAKTRLFNELLTKTKSDCRVQLTDVCTIQGGQIDPTQEPYRAMIHIAPDDIESSTGRILERNTAAEDGVSSGNYFFSEAAILYSKIRPNLRKVALVDFEGVCSADVYPLYAKSNILRDFLYLLLLSPNFTSYAVVRSIRSAIPKINRDDLLKYAFDLPSIAAQEHIIDRMKVFEINIQSVDNHINQLKELKQKCLSELLVVEGL